MAHAQAASRRQDWPEAVIRWSAVLEQAGEAAPPRPYARLARAYRRLGDLAGCRQALMTGQARHPDDVDLAIERAELAMAEGDWPAAVEGWEAILRGGDDGLPARIWARVSRAYRATENLEAAADAIQRGRAREPHSLDIAVEAGRLALSRYRTADEDERLYRREQLGKAQRSLQRARAQHEDTRSSLTLLGDLALALKDWTTAIDAWDAVAARYPDIAPKAHLRRAQAYRKTGDAAAARQALEQVHGEVALSWSYRAEVRSLTRQVGRWTAADATHLATLRTRIRDRTAVSRILSGALHAYGYSSEQVEAVHPLLREITRIVGDWPLAQPGTPATDEGPLPAVQMRLGPAEPSISPAAPSPARDVLHVSGFLYSGSGAVFDYLREHPDVHAPFGLREVGFLKKPGHFGLLAEATLDEEYLPSTITESICANVFGFGQTGGSLLSFFLDSPLDTARFVGHTCELVRRLAEAASGNDVEIGRSIQEALNGYLDAVVAELTPKGRVALLNNAIIANDLHRLSLHTHARAIAVFRDPRDQYVSQRLESPYALECSAFIDLMEERFGQFHRLMRDPEFTDRIIPVAFEDFVTDETFRRGLLQRLGLDAGTSTGSGVRSFSPERSRRNIAIHRAYSEPAEVARVHDALAHLLPTDVAHL